MLQVSIKKQMPEYQLQVEFNLANGILVLFGPSGCGKTTILRNIAGLAKPDQGKIIIHNQVLFSSEAKVNLTPQQRQIGFMFQDYALFPHMNVEKNIFYGVIKPDSSTTKLYSKLVELLKLKPLIKKYPQELSGGEKQKVALARSLMTKPKALLLDEPFSALDFDIRKKLQDEIIEIQKIWDIPFVLVTHDRQEAQKMGNHTLYLEYGKIKTAV